VAPAPACARGAVVVPLPAGRRLGDGGPRCAHGKLWCAHALNQCCLSEAWQEIIRDSFVVDIRAVQADEDGSMRGAVREVVKYCTKLTEVSAREREDGLSDVLELHRAIRKRRLLMTAGVFRGLGEPITAEKLLDQADSSPCTVCGTAWETVTAAWDSIARHYWVHRVSVAAREHSGLRGAPLFGKRGTA
jgi:Replication protein